MYVLNDEGNVIQFTDVKGVLKNMEYRYLEYQISDGYVIKIYNEFPQIIAEGDKIAISNSINFEEGSEYDNYIVVQEVDAKDNLTSSCMIRQPDSIKFLRQERDRLTIELTSTQSLLAESNATLLGLMETIILP
ncbi:hypothetical protein [Clostridium sp. FP1]|uniref:hypothetical protein n=1 Tax=Clostridium sp. FP1 TaxID=2724076 RepID=UPI0013E99148|nr:hypothetical protein [Clostridium sp. FP1]MBZ9637517.1 hypothetical protein [Clostridium sp. FP1]